ncbi:hypothetical protein Csa_023969 [Cucumis sativus]|nr:hypothetical protein Csa_023969 [Cucumis sativus]
MATLPLPLLLLPSFILADLFTIYRTSSPTLPVSMGQKPLAAKASF